MGKLYMHDTLVMLLALAHCTDITRRNALDGVFEMQCSCMFYMFHLDILFDLQLMFIGLT